MVAAAIITILGLLAQFFTIEGLRISKSTIVMADYSFEDNGEIKQGGGYTTIPTKNILRIKKIKI